MSRRQTTEPRRADPKNAGALSIPVPIVINEAAAPPTDEDTDAIHRDR